MLFTVDSQHLFAKKFVSMGTSGIALINNAKFDVEQQTRWAQLGLALR